ARALRRGARLGRRRARRRADRRAHGDAPARGRAAARAVGPHGAALVRRRRRRPHAALYADAHPRSGAVLHALRRPARRRRRCEPEHWCRGIPGFGPVPRQGRSVSATIQDATHMSFSYVVSVWALLALSFTIVAIASTRQLFARSREAARRPRVWPHIALVRPCEGLDPSLAETLRSSATAKYEGARTIFFC